MEYLTVQNKKIIFLNHQKLVNDSFNIYNANFALKAELFNFNAKTVEKQNSTTLNAADNAVDGNHYAHNDVAFNMELTQQQLPIEKRKCKRKSNSNNCNKKADSNFYEFSALCTAICAEIQNKQLIKNNCVDKHEMKRYWELPQQFAQFRGMNTTNEFQTISYENDNYILPVNSRFYNRDIKELACLLPELGNDYDLIVLDPPWRNKYIRRCKRVRMELGYPLLYNDDIARLPIKNLTNKRTIVAIWCTNSKALHECLIDELLSAWELRLLHIMKWLKLNTSGELIHPLGAENQKQPYEHLFIACQHDAPIDFCNEIKNIDYLASVPSIVHSHKPPLTRCFEKVMPIRPKCLELFARYLQPNYTSIGFEVLKLMNVHLYNNKHANESVNAAEIDAVIDE